MSAIQNIPIEKLRPNPFRDLGTYPWIEDKIEALMKSYKEVGIFEGIIARPDPIDKGFYQKWFGHHRQEAAKRFGVSKLPIIIRDADDRQMIQAMAMENGEDYSTDFLVQLNTWEGGIQYLTGVPRDNAEKLQTLEIARLLGMTRADDTGKHGDRINDTAQACSAAYALINGGHLNRNDLRGLTINAARELTQSVLSQMDRIDKMASLTKNATPTSVKQAKGFVAAAGKATANRVRAGQVSHRGIRGEVAANAFTKAVERHKADAPLPLLSAFADAVCRSLSKTLVDDYAAEKLQQIAKAIVQITLEADFAAIRRVQFELQEISKRAGTWERRITPSKEKIVSLKQLEDK